MKIFEFFFYINLKVTQRAKADVGTVWFIAYKRNDYKWAFGVEYK